MWLLFDGCHFGHQWFLFHAWLQGDRLTVGLNGDNSIRRLKGPGRPLYAAEERRAMLLQLPWVYEVLVFDTDDAADLVRALQPSILVKGEESRPGGRPCPEREVAAELGIEVIYLPRVGDYSTTKLVEELLEKR